MEIDLVGESLKFMVLGMTIVFAFLILLVQVMKLQAKIIGKLFPEKEPVVTAPANDSEEESRRVAAILAAVTDFRNNKS
jgi:oxaloacetate decarboxylase gamma subunit